jgi:pimeloyl-ACP methyl ester carboxylesterase
LLESVNDHATTHAVADQNCKGLSPRFRCVALDLPGHGDSAKPQTISIEMMGTAVNRVKDRIAARSELLLPVVKRARKSMNKDQGWIVCAANEKIDMVRTIRHVTAPLPISGLSARD